MGASGTDGSRHKEGARGASPKGSGAGKGAGRSLEDCPGGGAETVWDLDAERGGGGDAERKPRVPVGHPGGGLCSDSRITTLPPALTSYAPGPFTHPLCASVSSPVKCNNNSAILKGLWPEVNESTH